MLFLPKDPHITQTPPQTFPYHHSPMLILQSQRWSEEQRVPPPPRGEPGDGDKLGLKWHKCCGCSRKQQAAHQQLGSGMQREQPLTFLSPPELRSAAFPNTQHVHTAHTGHRDMLSNTNSCACEHISPEKTELTAADRSLSKARVQPLVGEPYRLLGEQGQQKHT